MPLTPSQILSANRRLLGGGGGSYAPVFTAGGGDRAGDLLSEEENPDSKKDSPGILSQIRSGLTDTIQTVGRGADYARAAVVSGALEAGEALRPLRGAESTASFGDLKANINRRMGTGDVLEESSLTTDLPLNVKRALGLAGDLVTDPLNYVTFGQSTAAKTGLGRLAASQGDEVATALAREGADAADNIIAKRFAQEQADAAAELASHEAARAERLTARAAEPQQLDLLDESVGVIDEAPVPRPSILDETAPKVSDILGERSLRAIGRTGEGGIGVNLGRLSSKTLIPGSKFESLGNVLAKPGRALGETALGSEILAPFTAARQAGRKAFIVGAETRDAFGNKIADAMPGIVRRRAAQIELATTDLDRTIAPLLKSVSPDEMGTITAALDVTGSVEGALVELADNPQAQKLLTALSDSQAKAYDTLIQAGKSEDELMGRAEYLRHKLTEAGAEKLGIRPSTIRKAAGTRSGNLKQRTLVAGEKLDGKMLVTGSVKEKNEILGMAAYVDDPVELTRLSLRYAQEVGGNAMAADALEDYAKRVAGFDASTVVRHKETAGFVKIAPDRWVPETIAKDWFALTKEGMDSVFLQHFDALSNAIKRQTLFNPIAAGPYMAQNAGTGIAMNAVDGARIGDYTRISNLVHLAHKTVAEVGEKNLYDELAKSLDPADLELVKNLRAEGHLAPGAKDFGADFAATGTGPLASKSKGVRKYINKETGTVKIARANQHLEEVLRGVSFEAARRKGMSVAEASQHVITRHLDYTRLGKTAFERNVVNRFMFFPTWLLKAPTAIVRAYAHNPGAMMAQARIEMGTQWYDRERNDYGEVLGARLSGPLSFATGLGYDVGGEPLELLNPLVQAGLRPENSHITEALPPLSTIIGKPNGQAGGRLGGILEDDAKRSRFLRSLAGVRTGVDYGAVRSKDEFQSDLAKRAAMLEERTTAGERPLPKYTESQLLKMEADKAGVEDPYSMNSGELARALKAKGYTKAEIAKVIEPAQG